MLHSILCVKRNAIPHELKRIKNVMHVLLWYVVVISTENNNYKIIWMPAPAHSTISFVSVKPCWWSGLLIIIPHLLNDVFLPFHISRHLYLTNLIIPSLENRIIIYAQSFVVTSENRVNKTKTRHRNIFTRYEFVMRRALPQQ